MSLELVASVPPSFRLQSLVFFPLLSSPRHHSKIIIDMLNPFLCERAIFKNHQSIHMPPRNLYDANARMSRCYAPAQTKQSARLRANAIVLILPHSTSILRVFRPFRPLWSSESQLLNVSTREKFTSTDEGSFNSPSEARRGRSARHSSTVGSARNCPPASREWPAISAFPLVPMFTSSLTVSVLGGNKPLGSSGFHLLSSFR